MLAVGEIRRNFTGMALPLLLSVPSDQAFHLPKFATPQRIGLQKVYEKAARRSAEALFQKSIDGSPRDFVFAHCRREHKGFAADAVLHEPFRLHNPQKRMGRLVVRLLRSREVIDDLFHGRFFQSPKRL